MKVVLDIDYGHYLTIVDGYLGECLQSTTEAFKNGVILKEGASEVLDQYSISPEDFDKYALERAEAAVLGGKQS